MRVRTALTMHHLRCLRTRVSKLGAFGCVFCVLRSVCVPAFSENTEHRKKHNCVLLRFLRSFCVPAFSGAWFWACCVLLLLSAHVAFFRVLPVPMAAFSACCVLPRSAFRCVLLRSAFSENTAFSAFSSDSAGLRSARVLCVFRSENTKKHAFLNI